MMDASASATGGIYIHVPFCLHKCPYCDFYSVAEPALKPIFLEALFSEIAAAKPEDLVFDTIYIGGGTPSILEPGEVKAIIGAAFSRFRFEGSVELTLEANPGTVDFEKLKGFRASGINRINIGVQSFQDRNLELLGRVHSAEQAQTALADARRAGFEAIGLDLIYGLPGQQMEDWRFDLESALAHEPEHLACYMLTVESGTPLGEDQRRGCFRPAADGQVAELFLATSEFLSSRGFWHYEVSNFARRHTGSREAAWVSRHNSKYWRHAPYLGFGPAAHSFLPPRRFWNDRSVQRYADALRAGRSPFGGEEVLTAEQEMLEVIMLGLRTAAGIDLGYFKRRFGVEFMDRCGAQAVELASQGLLTLSGERCAPTRRGMLYLNSITAALM